MSLYLNTQGRQEPIVFIKGAGLWEGKVTGKRQQQLQPAPISSHK